MAELQVDETLFGIAAAAAPTAVVVGAPLDLSAGCRDGGGNRPVAVREASRALEAYSPVLDRDLNELAVADLGDLELPADFPRALEQIESAIGDIAVGGRLPVLIGGEHTVSLAAVRALRRLYPDLVLLQIDAHTDLRSRYEGETISRATWIPQSGIELDHVVQVGVRSSAAEIAHGAARGTAHTSESLELPRELLADRPVYLSIDIDVLDPAFAPGVLCPEPGGVTPRELVALAHSLSGLDIVGLDVVEIAPDTDPGGLTALAAAKLLRELLLLLA